MNLSYSKFRQSIVYLTVACLVTWIVPHHFSHFSETLALVNSGKQILYTFWYGISFLIFGEMVGIYARKSNRFTVRSLFIFLLASFLAGLSLIIIVWILEYDFVGRLAILKIASGTGVLCFLFFSLQNWYSRKNKVNCLLCLSRNSKKIIQYELKRIESSYVLLEWEEKNSKLSINEFCAKNNVDLLVLESQNGSGHLDVVPLLEAGIRIMNLKDFSEKNLEKIPPAFVNRSWLLGLDLRMRDPLLHKIKRIMDITVGSFGLLFSLPILIPSLLVIALNSGFPVFFSQTRTGFLGREYVLYKLRTMKKDAENDGAVWANKKDSRITHVGKFLRKWRIDEIPQFWNIIIGDMSIVGPRPERPEFQEQLKKDVPHWNCRHLVKPGLTGWAQIQFEYASDLKSSEEKLAYDLYYIKHASIIFDIQIILSTLRSIAKGSR